MTEQKFAYSLSFADVIGILKLIDETHFRELELDLGDLKLRVLQDSVEARTAPGPKPKAEPQQEVKHPGDQVQGRASQPMLESSVPSAEASDGVTMVLAPLAGTFYRAPSPGATPFVEPGSRVREGDVVGILEIMKLMNQVTAPCGGVVREILAQNEEFVEYGQPLAAIVPGPVA